MELKSWVMLISWLKQKCSLHDTEKWLADIPEKDVLCRNATVALLKAEQLGGCSYL
jgi:hypothetical protein